MSFRGELREFELPDILQLIASQKKAGWLKVISKGNCHFVFFRDGKITSTKNPAEESDPIEDYIVRRGILSDDQMDRVAATRRKTGMDVQDVLQKEGLLEIEDVQEIFDAMVEQDIFELMSIRSGTYEFETEERPGPLPEGALASEIGPILMEGARKADEVSEMRKALGPENGVLVLTSVGREATPSNPDEAAVMELVNGSRPIDTIIEESGLDRYTGTRALFDCARQGWVSLSRRGRSATAEAAVAEEFELGRTVRWLAPVAAMLLVAVLFSDVLDRYRADDPLVGEWRNRTAQLDRGTLREGVRYAVEVYRLEHDRYPESLDALVEEQLLPGVAVIDREGPRWIYSTTEDGEAYVLAPGRPASPAPADPGEAVPDDDDEAGMAEVPSPDAPTGT